MKSLHNRLLEKSSWYSKWHQNPSHGVVHWIAFLVIVALITQTTLNAIAKNLPSVANPIAVRASGAILDKEEDIKKLPRTVLVPKGQRAPAPSDGESLIAVEALASLPTSYILDTYTPPDQGSEGACAAFAATNQRSIEEHYKTGAPYSKDSNIFSPEFTYNRAGMSCGDGSGLLGELTEMINDGIPTWNTMPYSTFNGCGTMPNTEQSAEASRYKGGTASYFIATDQTMIKTMLNNNHPLSFTYQLDSNWYNIGTGTWVGPHLHNMYTHASTVVGYDDSRHAYKVMNTWGPTWGDGGYGWIDYDFFGAEVAGYVYVFYTATSSDTTPPVATMTAPVSGATVSGIIPLSATASDNTAVAGVRFRVDGVTIGSEDTTAPYSVSWNASAFTTGSHTITAVVRDAAGNQTAANPITVNVTGGDTIAPNVSTITSPINGSTEPGAVSVNVTAADNMGVREFALIDAATGYTFAVDTEAPYSINYFKKTSGPTSLMAQVKDFANNILNSAPVNITYTPDFTSAVATITAPQTNTSYPFGTSSIPYSYTFSDNVLVATTATYIDGIRQSSKVWNQVSGSHSSSVSTTGLAAGAHILRVTATDTSGNGSASQITINLTATADTTAPAVSITTPTNGTTVSGTTSVIATATDNVGISKVEFYLDSNATPFATDTVAPYTGDMNTLPLTNGTHTFKARAFDTTGNGTTSSVISVTVNNTTADTTVPAVNLTSPTAGQVVTGSAVFVGATATDNVGIAKVEFYAGSTLIGTDTTYTYGLNWNTTTLMNGTYSLTAKAFDAAGNVATSAPVSVIVNNGDITPPSAAITSPINNAIATNTMSITANASDNVSITKVDFYWVTLSGAETLISTDTTAPYSSSWNTVTVPNASYYLVAKATDPSGNVGTSVRVTVTVNNASTDTTAPAVSITSPVNGTTVSGTNTVTATATDNIAVARVEFYLDSNTTPFATDTTAPYSGDMNTVPLTNGAHTYKAKAYDAAGNVATSSTISVTVSNTTIDTTAPTTSITAPVNGSRLKGQKTTIKGTATDNVRVSKMEIYIDNVLTYQTTPNTSSSTISYTWNFNGVAAGNHTILLKSTDSSNNVGQSTITVTK